MLGVPDKEEIFFKSTYFALAGAVPHGDRNNGNKVLRWLVKQYGESRVIPIHPTAGSLEGITCVKKLSELPDPGDTVLGIATPPTDTRKLLEDACQVNLPMIWIQPGAEDLSIIQDIEKEDEDPRYRDIPARDCIIYSTASGSDPAPDIVEVGDTFKHTVFFNSQRFAVAMAHSINDQENGKMVLWWLIRHLGMPNVVLVHPTRKAYQGISCVKELSMLPDSKNTVLVLATSPADSRKYLQDAKRVGLPMIWIQPGAEDSSIIRDIERENEDTEGRLMPARDRVIYRSALDNIPPDIIPSGNTYLKNKQTIFFTSRRFALAGASSQDDQKHGNKALRWLKDHYEKPRIMPVHRTASILEDLTCVKELSELTNPEETVLGIITKPSDTLNLLRTARDLHIRMIWLQPGAEMSDSVIRYIRETNMETYVVYSPLPIPVFRPERSYDSGKEGTGHSQGTGPIQADGTSPGCGSDIRPDIIVNGNDYFASPPSRRHL